MNLTRTMLLIGILMISILFLMTGCNDTPIRETFGSISISSSITDLKARVISCDEQDAAVTSYTLTGTGPGGATLTEVTSSNGMFAVGNLTAGSWTFTVIGKNASGDTILSGSTTATVVSGEVIQISIPLLPSEGTADVQLTFTWPDDVTVDSLSGTLTPYPGNTGSINLSFTSYNSGEYTCSLASLESGFYQLTVNADVGTASPALGTFTEILIVYPGITMNKMILLGKRQPMFKVANQWGVGGWENVDDGFIWMTAEALKEANTVAFFQGNIEDYDPKYVVSFTLEHPERTEVVVSLLLLEGEDTIDDERSVAERYFGPYNLYNQYPEETGYAFPTHPVVMDITDWADKLTSDRKLVLWVWSYDADFYLRDFSLEVYDGYANEPVQTLLAAVDENPYGEITKELSLATLVDPDTTAKATLKRQNPISRALQTRTISDAEFLRLKEQVGVRDLAKQYNTIIDGHGTGLIPPTQQQWENMRPTLKTVELKDALILPSPSYSNEVDLSEDPAFPPIGDQGRLGSCVAFASTYYTRTFQEAKEHGWDLSTTGWDAVNGRPDANLDKIISPAFVYNVANGGYDAGLYYDDAYRLLEDTGASTWALMPYDGDDENDVDSYSIWPVEDAWREALLYRASSNDTVGGVNYYFSVYSDSEIEVIRRLIDAGIPVTISIDANEYADLYLNDVWDEDNYVPNGTNHANTIVGYRL